MTTAIVFLCYLVIVGGICYWRLRVSKGRAGRNPIGDDKKLIRQPGEGLRRSMAGLDERFLNDFILLLSVPLGVGGMTLVLGAVIPGTAAVGWVIAAAALGGLGFVICLRRMMETAGEMRNCRLGLAGERFVADQLAELTNKGYSIFHDVPCQGATGMFNLDHVVVGGGGVAVIETKTRRKKGPEDGSKDHAVTYDGSVLIWPGGFRDSHSVEQAVSNARWLKEHLQKALNITAAPLPVLTIPGWWVEAKAREPVAALNPRTLAGALPARMAKTLTAEQSDLIVRNLSALCRDVDFNDPV